MSEVNIVGYDVLVAVVVVVAAGVEVPEVEN